MLPKEALLSYFPKMTFRRYQHLIASRLSLDDAWSAKSDTLKKTLLWESNIIEQFVFWRDHECIEKNIEEQLIAHGIDVIPLSDSRYPALLKQTYDPPICLFVRGNLDAKGSMLAVVGTRSFSPYGKQVTEELVTALVHAGLTIVSGLALGIDGCAHAATLASGGNTIAVLGSGIDRWTIFPAVHRPLAEKIIAADGAVIAEYPPGFLPTAYSFPERNRIIAGLSLGTLVVEAGEKSGALITARSALDNNREVFAVPHNITSKTSGGTNTLIKMGATLVTSAEDIFQVLNLSEIKQTLAPSIHPESEEEAALLPLLSREPLHMDEIIHQSGLGSSRVMSTMTLMEMKGKVRNIGGMMYVLSHESPSQK